MLRVSTNLFNNGVILSIGTILTISTGYLAYKNRMGIFENCNSYFIGISNLITNIYPIRIQKTLVLNSVKIYNITLLDRPFIVTDLKIDIEAYEKLKNSLVIPHTPDDILETVILIGTEKIDITDISKLLIGPFLNQFDDTNSSWIFEYLSSEYEYNNIDEIQLTFINGQKNKLKSKDI